MTSPEVADDRSITVSHLIRGPRILVFRASTGAHHLGRWPLEGGRQTLARLAEDIETRAG